jgi:phage terminase large subunit GpA-like protein
MTHRCLECGENFEKFLWLAGDGEWRAHHPFNERGEKILTRGFYLSGLYNPWVEWQILVDEFVRAVRANEEGDIEPLKAFRNTRLGQLHDDTGQRIDIDLYAERREDYTAEIPEGVLAMTAGVDVGEYAINYEIVGWGRGRESWGIEYGMIDGDPREGDVWDLLDEAVYRRILLTHDGKRMRCRKIAVDSGYAADFVYAYTKPRQPRCIAIKGEGGLGKPFIKGAGTFTKSNRARLQIIGVDSGKEEIVNRLLVSNVGAGYCHFPRLKNGEAARGYDEEYFKGLTAERRIVKSKHGFRTYIWTKRLSQRNEPFDSRNYALAALAIPYAGMNLATMERDVLTATEQRGDVVFGAQRQRMTEARATEQKGGGKFGAQNRGIS